MFYYIIQYKFINFVVLLKVFKTFNQEVFDSFLLYGTARHTGSGTDTSLADGLQLLREQHLSYRYSEGAEEEYKQSSKFHTYQT